MLKCRALWIGRRHCPVSIERSTSCEESYLCGAPSDGNVYCEVQNHSLDSEAESKAGVHYQHAGFDGIDHVQHCLGDAVRQVWTEMKEKGKDRTCSETITILDPLIRSLISSGVNVENSSGS